MKTSIAVFDSYDKALKAIQTLKEANFPAANVSLVGKADLVDDHLHVNHLPETTASIGAVGGSVLGVLTGLGVFAIPGFGFLYGAGALVGALAGFDLGIIGGGVGAVLAKLGIGEQPEDHETFGKHLQEGRILVTAQGTEEELNHAKEILAEHGLKKNVEAV